MNRFQVLLSNSTCVATPRDLGVALALDWVGEGGHISEIGCNIACRLIVRLFSSLIGYLWNLSPPPPPRHRFRPPHPPRPHHVRHPCHPPPPCVILDLLRSLRRSAGRVKRGFGYFLSSLTVAHINLQ